MKPTRDDATQWGLERHRLYSEIGILRRHVRRQLRDAWESFRDVFPDQAHEMPWTSAGEKEIPKVTRDLLTKIVERTADSQLPELLQQAEDHLRDTEE